MSAFKTLYLDSGELSVIKSLLDHAENEIVLRDPSEFSEDENSKFAKIEKKVTYLKRYVTSVEYQ